MATPVQALRRATGLANPGPSMRPWTRPARNFDQLPRAQRPKCLLLHDIPSSALPSDVLRVLKDRQAVPPDFPLSAITSPPHCVPRTPSMTRTFHVTAADWEQAASIRTALGRYPLFASTLGAASSGRAPAMSPVAGTPASAHEWVQGFLDRAAAAAETRALASGRGGRSAAPAAAAPDSLSAAWVADPAARGRRVSLRGLPGGMTEERVQRLLANQSLARGREAVKRAISSHHSLASAWIISADSVSAAYAIARKLHLNYYDGERYGTQFLMRAEVIW